MSKITLPNTNIQGITISALEFKPKDFNKSKKYPAIVVSHPITGVKEQTAGLYAEKLAEHGFITFAFDRSYQGESTGKPRQLENPFVSTEDVSAVIDHLIALTYIDIDRIGSFGICGGGGYSVNAAINDRRIKAVAGVSTINIGILSRKGWDGTAEPEKGILYLIGGASARTADVETGKSQTFTAVPDKKEEAPFKEYEYAFDYYKNTHKQPTAPGYILARSFSLLETYDAYACAELFLTQPLLLIAGSEAGTHWYSEELVKRAASEDKQVYTVKGANHFELFVVPEYVDEALSQLVPFFTKHL